MNATTLIQRLEGGLIAAVSIGGTIALAPSLWWLPLAAFLVFDLSALGYLRSPRLGAISYNAVHNYAWPAVVGLVALVSLPFSATVALVCALVALAGAFHVGVDRALGYGLKHPDAFTHTHLGWIGRDRSEPHEV
ncbi:DUF4260 domain-containing protein [Herbiconiux sp. L3-i23]|uniref:DUF4260 domain-containing protein n=1 Tax=Herbiconiux sp. L3-i23 TaxID=2905871 RepID=UPI00206B3033|nr:DUF4260 domain-containing protein [Herbiconiux sp. L3-i23]BDI21421.1 hypothetical protein L3i23_01970 [Herbiconiux sp. L3-i23]